MFLLFNIINPFKNFVKKFWRYHWYWDKKLSSHKWLEIETFIDSTHIFEIQVDLKFYGSDHAGPSLELVLFCVGFTIRIYDQRHWDYKSNNWED